MKNALIALLFAASCFAQTATKKPPVKPQSSCSIALKATAQAADSMSAELVAARAENERLKKENLELTAKAAEADKKFADLREAAVPVYNYALQLQGALKQATADNEALANKYNYLLADAKEQMTRANDALVRMNAQYARQQRFANALAIYALMPKYQPVPLPPPPVFTTPANVNISCTSNTMGITTYTNCH